MARLPTVGGDDGNWGTLLNSFLQVEHASDGTLKSRALNAKNYGAVGDGITDDTAALTSWINALNSATAGAGGYLPAGQYMITSALPSITNSSVTIFGDGWAQAANTIGSVISAKTGFPLATAMLILAGEGIELRDITIDGQNHADTIIAITGAHVRLLSMQARGVTAGNVCVDVQTGGSSVWIDTCVINGINGANTGIQINDTDAIIVNSKPQNSAYNIVLLGGASGTIIANNHMTPGQSFGQNCIYINGSPSHVIINGNRFDNFVYSAIQLTPSSSTPNNIQITNNQFHSIYITDNTFALIGFDTTNSGIRGLHIIGNAGYAKITNRPAYGLSAQTQSGGTPTNPTRISTVGTIFNSNNFWVVNTMFGTNSNPTLAKSNMITTDGTTYSSVTDIPAGSSLDSTASDIQLNGNQAAGTVGLAADAGHIHPTQLWLPSDNGLLTATNDPFTCQANGTMIAGTLYLIKLPIRYAITITNLWWAIQGAGVGASSGSFTGLYNSSGSLLSGSADIGASFTSTGAVQIALTTPQALTAGSFVWAAILMNLATTQPNLFCGTKLSGVVNLGISGNAKRFCTNGTSLISLPASITLASNSSSSLPFWAGAS
ncbi:MAG TPA: glycosyl hydrolase family 28-related protein [Patescibacteria group bacterium]